MQKFFLVYLIIKRIHNTIYNSKISTSNNAYIKGLALELVLSYPKIYRNLCSALPYIGMCNIVASIHYVLPSGYFFR